MDSISVAGISEILLTGKPSTMNKGVLSLVIEPPPRTLIITSASGFPSGVVIFTPASLPAIASTGEATGTDAMVALSNEATEPVISLRFTVPYPIATTSSSICASSFNTIFKDSTDDVIFTFWVIYPTYETVRISPAEAFNSKFPDISVTEPLPLFCTITFTPIKGSPVSSTTVPASFFCCTTSFFSTTSSDKII